MAKHDPYLGSFFLLKMSLWKRVGAGESQGGDNALKYKTSLLGDPRNASAHEKRNNATVSEQRNRARTTQPRTNNANANDSV